MLFLNLQCISRSRNRHLYNRDNRNKNRRTEARPINQSRNRGRITMMTGAVEVTNSTIMILKE